MPINIHDVAREAGVSVSTASRVIREAGYVSQSTRSRVQIAIEKLQYRPNMTARQLKYGRTFSIGFVMGDISNPFFGLAVKGAEQFIRSNGGQEYELILFNTNGESHSEIKAIETMVNKRVEGIIIASTASDECLELLRKVQDEYHIPIVSIDNELGVGEVGIVTAGNTLGSYELVSHLVNVHHHSRIGLISGPAQESHACERLEGCLQVFRQAALPIEDDLIQSGKWSYEDGYQITQDWIKKDILPTAIYCSNNLMGMGAISALRENNLRVPQDVAVVSFDDMQFGHLLTPRLTHLDYAWDKIGEETAKLLLEGINAQTEAVNPVHIKLPVTLVIRDSCGCNCM
ncbi:MAG: LacI family DNA-binding transcriptional regulator [Chloroflexota bacterium]